MVPILATAAVSVAGEILQHLANKDVNRPPKPDSIQAGPAKFSTLLDKHISATGPVGASAAQFHQKVDELTKRLFQSTEVTGAINQSGGSGPWQIQLDAQGGAELRSANGALTPIHLSESTAALARELFQLRAAPSAGTPAVNFGRPGSHPAMIVVSGQ